MFHSTTDALSKPKSSAPDRSASKAANGWNPALDHLPPSSIRRMFNLAATMRDVIHLSIGQPDAPVPDHVIEAYIQALRDGKTRYTQDAGLPELLHALAARYAARTGHALTP